MAGHQNLPHTNHGSTINPDQASTTTHSAISNITNPISNNRRPRKGGG
jgi:hypothetical protein